MISEIPKTTNEDMLETSKTWYTLCSERAILKAVATVDQNKMLSPANK